MSNISIIQIVNQIMPNTKKCLIFKINIMMNYLIDIWNILKKNLNYGEISLNHQKHLLNVWMWNKSLEVSNMIKKVVVLFNFHRNSHKRNNLWSVDWEVIKKYQILMKNNSIILKLWRKLTQNIVLIAKEK